MNRTIYQFKTVARFSDQYPCQAIKVNASVGCGHYFPEVAAILKPESPNPVLLLPKGLGVSGVKTILEMLQRWRDA